MTAAFGRESSSLLTFVLSQWLGQLWDTDFRGLNPKPFDSRARGPEEGNYCLVQLQAQRPDPRPEALKHHPKKPQTQARRPTTNLTAPLRTNLMVDLMLDLDFKHRFAQARSPSFCKGRGSTVICLPRNHCMAYPIESWLLTASRWGRRFSMMTPEQS